MLRLLGVACAAVIAGGACADEGEPLVGHRSVCDTPQGPLLGCAPPSAEGRIETVEDACWKLVRCGLLPVEQTDAEGNHFGDWYDCVDDLQRGGQDGYTPDRLEFTLRCVEVSTCQELQGGLEGPCFRFGGEP